MAIYMNMVFILHFSVDFLLLLGTNRIMAHSVGFLRCLVSALLGGVYAVACMLPGFSVLGEPVWRMLCFGVMTVVGFGWRRDAVQRGCVFFVLSMALEYIAGSRDSQTWTGLLLCAAVLFLLRSLGSRGHPGQEYRVLKLTLGEKSVSLLALQDTGNTLCDPVTGEGVVVISAKAAENLTGMTQEALRTPLETLARHPLPGMRLIPYRTVGGCGMMLGLRFRQAELDGKQKSLLVAFSPMGLGTGEIYQALTGGCV